MSDNGRVNRRSVLKSMGATGAAVAGLSGTASASDGATVQRVSAEKATGIIESHAEGVLEALSNEGFISEASTASLNLSESVDLRITPLSVGRGDETAPTLAAHGVLGNGEVNVFVDLEAGKAHAADTSGDSPTFYRDGYAVPSDIEPEESDCDFSGPSGCTNECDDYTCDLFKNTVLEKNWDPDICDCNVAGYQYGNCC